MQLLLNIVDENILEEYPYVIKREAREGIDREYGLRPEDDVKVVNIGPGADWIVLLATISSAAWELFKLPGTIRDALDGWKWLIEKIKEYKSKEQLVSLDMDAAGMLAIDYLADKYGDSADFNVMDAHTFEIISVAGMFPDQPESLAANPHNYHVFTFWVNSRIIVLSVRSTGKIRELESFDYTPYGLYDTKA